MTLFDLLVSRYDFLYRIYMRVYGWVSPRTIATTIFGTKFVCARADFIQRRLAFFGLFEPNLTYFTRSALGPDDIFIDVGANIGYFTMMAAVAVGPGGKVYAIEASPRTYELLRANLALNGLENVVAVNVAVTDTECYVRLGSVDSRNLGATMVERVAGPEAGSIRGRPLADIVAPDMDNARMIKVDVEGSEHLILPAIFDRLATSDRNTIVVSEVSEKNAHLIELARSKGLAVGALRNNYTISHLLIRRFLRLTGEGEFFTIEDAHTYLTPLHDYIFSREPVTSIPRHVNTASAGQALPASMPTCGYPVESAVS
jgi:FkbM family methyltransferase